MNCTIKRMEEILESISKKEIEKKDDIGNMSLVEDLEFDSLQLVELISYIEEEYHFYFDDYETMLNHNWQINNLIDCINVKIKTLEGMKEDERSGT
ncbi:MAG: acyl carrier protein [Lachnospiraceae bacterium]|nr:acyl carrier protein [Lachnospiraceae bacterium]